MANRNVSTLFRVFSFERGELRVQTDCTSKIKNVKSILKSSKPSLTK